MSFFRIDLYLTLKQFFLSFLIKEKNITKKIHQFLRALSKKKEVVLTSQLRVGFILVLKYLKWKYPNKKQVIINSYNLAEMVNICKNLELEIIFTKLNENLFIDEKDLKKKINKKTLAVVTTNIFNTFNDLRKVKYICSKLKVPLIEDNAIYFGNYKKEGKKKIFSGSFGDYSLNSFNIMKNISAMYGGSVATNDKKFIVYANNELRTYDNFSNLIFLKQSFIFLILNILKIRVIYKLFFFNVIKYATQKDNHLILSLVYPSLRFKIQNFPNYYFTRMHVISKKMVFLQISNQDNFNYNHKKKRENNIFYFNTLKKKKIKGIKLLKYEDPNFQNFNDFPILVNKKKELVDYLFSKGIEIKTIQYLDCHKIFKKKKLSKRLDNYEDRVLCLPNHKSIKREYIEYIVKHLVKFYDNGEKK